MEEHPAQPIYTHLVRGCIFRIVHPIDQDNKKGTRKVEPLHKPIEMGLLDILPFDLSFDGNIDLL